MPAAESGSDALLYGVRGVSGRKSLGWQSVGKNLKGWFSGGWPYDCSRRFKTLRKVAENDTWVFSVALKKNTTERENRRVGVQTLRNDHEAAGLDTRLQHDLLSDHVEAD